MTMRLQCVRTYSAAMARLSLVAMMVVMVMIARSRAFNLEPRLAVIKKGPSDSYFGYSVAQHIIFDEAHWRPLQSVYLVGAPRAQTTQPGTNRSGAVFSCPLDSAFNNCEQLPIENDERPPDDSVDKNDQWLGVTVKSQGPGGYVMACAHRYVIKGSYERLGLGICYSLHQTLDFHKVWSVCENRPAAKLHEEFGFCQSGTSGEISADNDLIIGAPGPYTWKGTIFLNNVRFQMQDDRKWYMGPVLDKYSPVHSYSYLGMAVTSGKFFDSKMVFVAGAPRSRETGEVIFFARKGGDVLDVLLTLSGEQIASSYGYALTSLDLNKDGLPDLVVGAPFYYNKTEGGAVYVYMNSKEERINNQTKPIKLTGKLESRFGFALSSAGDLNRDGFEDLAIGAPYEENGAVYIYLGSASGLSKEPSQVIKASQLPQHVPLSTDGLKTFGYSLSGGMDMDNNGYPDLLVGAYESDVAILLRSRPVIDISSEVRDIENINPEIPNCHDGHSSPTVCFNVTACFKANSKNLRIGYRIEADVSRKFPRVKFQSSLNSNEQHIAKKILRAPLGQACLSELVYLKEMSDIQNPIVFQLTYELVNLTLPRLRYDGALANIDQYPILNQKGAKRTFRAKFMKDCGDDDKCVSDLEVKAKFGNKTSEDERPEVSLGERDVELYVTVENKEEPAYDANLYIMHPPGVSFIVAKPSTVQCTPENEMSVLICHLGNPFQRGAKVELYIKFDPKSIADHQTSLQFVVKANTTSFSLKERNDTVLEAPVVRKADLELRGSSHIDHEFYGGQLIGESAVKYEDQIGSRVKHVYVVKNNGYWTVRKAEVIISWPYEVENNKEHGKWLLYLMNQPEVVGNGHCAVPEGQINPLNVEPIKPEEPDTAELATEAEEPRSRRRKREVVILPEEIQEDGKTKKVVTMDCQKHTAKCFDIVCTAYNIRDMGTITIRINARLWNSTFVEDYPHVDRVSIFSEARIEIDPSLNIHQRTDNDHVRVETRIYPDIPLSQKPQEVPLWIIILSACGGILLLIIVIVILWKLGFFKRKKPEYELAPMEDKENHHPY